MSTILDHSPRFTADGVYRCNRPLTRQEIARAAPSVFAEDQHASRSDQYRYVPTAQILDNLEKYGFGVFGATQANTRDASKRDKTKHVLRIQRLDRGDQDEKTEVILMNSHDGSCSYRAMLGVYRFVCANGLITGETYAEHRIKHQGESVIRDVVEATAEVTQRGDALASQIAEMKQIELRPEQSRALALAAITARYPDEDKRPVVSADQILRPKRRADIGADLWTTFNRVQENITRGGFLAGTRDKYGRRQIRRARAVKGVDQNTALNKALFTLAEALKQAV